MQPSTEPKYRLRSRGPRLSIGAGVVTGFVLAGCLLFSCSAQQPIDEAAARKAEDARVQRAAEARLRSLFPEVQGSITRESLTKAIVASAAPHIGSGATRQAEVPAAAIAAIERGDFATARGLLGELLAHDEIEHARALLAAGDERGALSVLDRAVSIAPDSAELRTLRGETALMVAAESNDKEIVQGALDDFEEAVRQHGGPRALLGASRAARALGQGDKALTYARAGLDALDGADMLVYGSKGEPPIHAERVWAQASLDSWARGPADTNGVHGAASAREPVAALHASIGRAADDAWSWQELARVELGSGDAVAAHRVSNRGLSFFPHDGALHASLASALEAIGGQDAVIAEFAKRSTSHPHVAVAEQIEAEARYQSALDALVRKPGDAAAFARAEKLFAQARTDDAALADACRAREALCRTGAGFALLDVNDLEGARTAFLSVEDAQKGALARSDPPRLRSAVIGLDAIAATYVAASQPTNASGSWIESLERAARIHDYLRAYDVNDAHFALAAARENRDAALAIETEARTLASQKKIDEANQRLVRARELMEKSRLAFADAVKLAPLDVTVGQEAGAVLVDYVQRDPDVARGWLEGAAHAGEAKRDALSAQLDDPKLALDDPTLEAARTKAVRNELEVVRSALADVYQDLGVLYLTLLGDPVRAKQWGEKCLATSPDPPEEVRGKGGLIDLCNEAIEKGTDPRVRDETRWAAPIAPAK